MYKEALPPLINNSSRILILGTMPGDQSIAKQEYYGNKGNHFWRIMFTIFNQDYSLLYDDRKDLLKAHKVALWNVLANCMRIGSSDSKIKDEKVNDFESFHLQYPDIKYIFFESKSASKYYQKYVKPREDISYFIMPSTSGLNAGIPLSEKIDCWRKLAEVSGI
ncbi:DNA-deoxyinosine glycosylase [Flavobacterium psychroterrae]|uniref:DNA-deoxyinosine glycosylase n=1 Tax=Flavobacterium psychroterrae TaxID=2133767 RepID=A0ABS5PB50_9FLAO|nr:DNA-deoxyinosine glycosylase [Flavobacterium psychroterrae]MBS7231532.1 DNA-deoxyinosine glycosylase [Flavobacterium psychroterrae]